MSIAKFKSKVLSFINGDASEGFEDGGNYISKKLETISASFKSSPTIISKDLTFHGDITAAGMIEIEGKIVGSINGGSIILREEGSIEGQVTVESASIRGRFKGDIKAKSINIFSTAEVVGTIEYEVISVEDGALVDGQFKMV
jgi:cytoskeletal protein CcmA (bactofilin family)